MVGADLAVVPFMMDATHNSFIKLKCFTSVERELYRLLKTPFAFPVLVRFVAFRSNY